MRISSASLCFVAALAVATPVRADDIAAGIEVARGAYAKGDALHALTALQTATAQLNQRLGAQLAKMLPPAPQGWDAAGAEWQGLDEIGGGLTVTQAYSKGDATLNAALIVDNSSVVTAAAPSANRQGWTRIRLGSEDAMLRYDPSTKAGEITMVIGDRALLQVEGNEIASETALVDIAKGWNTQALRKLFLAGS